MTGRVSVNMWDHIFFGPAYDVKTATHNFLGNPAFAVQATQEYITSRTGILTNIREDLLGTYNAYPAVTCQMFADC